MTLRGTVCVTLTTVSGVLSAFVTLYGMISAYGIEFRVNTLLSALYCLLPFLTFPVFLLIKPARRSVTLRAGMTLIFAGVYAALNWRTCSELGYCTSVFATLYETLQTRTVVVMFLATMLSFLVVLIDTRAAAAREAKS